MAQMGGGGEEVLVLGYQRQRPSYLFLVEGIHPLHGCVQGCDHVQKVLVLFTEGIGK